MSDDIYFIPLIMAAWADPAPHVALAAAFAEIVRRGQEPRYQQGFAQFQKWIRLVAAHRAQLDWGARGALTAGLTETPAVGVQLFCDDRQLAVGEVRRGMDLVVHGVHPGVYQLVLETGWVVWEKPLEPADLLWSAVRGGRPLPAAAAVGEGQPARPDDIVPTPAGIEIRVFRGGQAGRLELALAPGGPAS